MDRDGTQNTLQALAFYLLVAATWYDLTFPYSRQLGRTVMCCLENPTLEDPLQINSWWLMLVSAHCMMEWGEYRNWVQGTDTNTSFFQVWSVHKSRSWAAVSRPLLQTQMAQHLLMTFWKIHPENIPPLFIYYNWFFDIFLLGVCSEQESELLPGAVSEVNCVSWIIIEPQVSLPGCVTQWPQRRQQHQQQQDSAMVIASYVHLHMYFLMILYMLRCYNTFWKFWKGLILCCEWLYELTLVQVVLSRPLHRVSACKATTAGGVPGCVVPGTGVKRGRMCHRCFGGVWYFPSCFLPWIPWALPY